MVQSLSGDRFGQIPIPLTSLVGRDDVVASVIALLREPNVRLVTLTGPGGVGKTRIALQVLSELHQDYSGQAQFVQLAAIADPDLVILAIADALSIPKDGERPLAERVAAVLRLHPFLLVLDNFEQVVAAAPSIAELLTHCPDLKILVTSRIVLRVSGEHEFAVPPLTLPDGVEGLQAIAESEAVELFLQRARAVRADFHLHADNAATIAAICERLDGLPLAIELAAAHVRLLPPSALLSQLEHSLTLLTAGPRDAPTRLQTMRNAIAWSFDLLQPEHQQLLQQLAVFVDSWSLAAAEAVIEPALRAALHDGVLSAISELIAQSLVQPIIQPDAEPRFRMLETIREFALERLEARGELDALRERHADWFAAYVDRTWFVGFSEHQHAAIERALREMPNLRAAMSWSFQQADPTFGVRIACDLGLVWMLHGPWSEGRAWTEQAIANIDWLDDMTALGLLLYYALNLSTSGDQINALAPAERAYQIGLSLGDDEYVGRTETVLGIVLIRRGDFERGESLLMQSAERYKRLNLAGLSGTAENALGAFVYARGDLARAQSLFESALRSQRSIGNTLGMAWPLNNLARLELDSGRLAVAAETYSESLALSWDVGGQISGLGCLRGLARVATSGGDHHTAVQFLAATSARSEAIGLILSTARRARFEQAIAETRAMLTPGAFEELWALGRSLSLPELVELGHGLAARLGESPSDAPAPVSAAVAKLSPRELDVLRLIATGQSTTEIAEQLFLSPRTVTTHLSSIYNKLGFNSRAAATRFAIQEHLV